MAVESKTAVGGTEVNYYENVVVDYLRADRALFVNTKCSIRGTTLIPAERIGTVMQWPWTSAQEASTCAKSLIAVNWLE